MAENGGFHSGSTYSNSEDERGGGGVDFGFDLAYGFDRLFLLLFLVPSSSGSGKEDEFSSLSKGEADKDGNDSEARAIKKVKILF